MRAADPHTRRGAVGVRRRLLTILVVLAATVLGGAVPASASVLDVPPLPVFGAFSGAPPQVTAASWILYDDTFDRVLGEQDPDTPRPMASTTKIMTALVALQYGDLDENVTVSELAADVGEAEAGLVPGEVLTLRELLSAMLVRSANDAAIAVAEGVAGNIETFVDLMNEKARELGLENTHFANPHGLDATGHFTTARDLLTMARVAMENPVFATLVRTQTIRLPDTPDGSQRILHTTNELLGSYEGSIGVKTGYTDAAGHVLVAAAQRDGRRLYAVVMGSTDSFGDAEALLDYGFSEFGVVEVIMKGTTYAQRRVASAADDMAADSTIETFASREEPVTVHTEFDGVVPVVSATVGDQAVGQSQLVGPEVEPLPTLGEAFRWISRYWTWLWGR
jgi:serine-type D-Ala-D-Ala carboxypeptidase (penicillin-binding protein 5/6)